MKKDIHPNYMETHVKCACGNEFVVKSTKPELLIETCSECHPQYTGKGVGTRKAGRAEKFNEKFGLNTNKAA